jgi:hypothetical protein
MNSFSEKLCRSKQHNGRKARRGVYNVGIDEISKPDTGDLS